MQEGQSLQTHPPCTLLHILATLQMPLAMSAGPQSLRPGTGRRRQAASGGTSGRRRRRTATASGNAPMRRRLKCVTRCALLTATATHQIDGVMRSTALKSSAAAVTSKVWSMTRLMSRTAILVAASHAATRMQAEEDADEDVLRSMTITVRHQRNDLPAASYDAPPAANMRSR